MTSANDVILEPGEFCFAGVGTRIHTLLGSCVSITVWHPALRVGGMCHYMLPERPGPGRGPGSRELDGRYADDAVQLFLREMRRIGTRPAEYQVKMFGGGNQFPDELDMAGPDIARDNVAAGFSLLKRHGFPLTSGQVGVAGACRLLFDISTGDAWVNFLTRQTAKEVAYRRTGGAPRHTWMLRTGACTRSPA